MKTKMLLANLCALTLLANCAGKEIKIEETELCSVAGVMAAGMNCAKTLSPDTREMDLQETLQFLEPQAAVYDEKGKLLSPEKGPAICASMDDFNKQKTALEIACIALGSLCTYEIKETIKKVSNTTNYLQVQAAQMDGVIMIKINSIPRYGDKGPNVLTLQKQLRVKGETVGSLDGDFGPKVLAAVKSIQKKNGLGGSGEIGSKTLKLLDIELESESTRPVSSALPTRREIAEQIVGCIAVDIRNGIRETGGKNRSPRIDEINLRGGGKLGDPYCATGGWCAIDDGCKILGLKNPVPRTASSQNFRRKSFVPEKYIRPAGELGQIGDVGTLQVPTDPDRGHHTVLTEDQLKQPLFDTAEYNTDGSGSRDGDGAYFMVRSTIDKSRENGGKLFASFADIPQWILDFNQA